MESLKNLEEFEGSEHNQYMDGGDSYPHPTRCLLLLQKRGDYWNLWRRAVSHLSGTCPAVNELQAQDRCTS